MVDYIRATFPSLYVHDDEATRDADLHRNDFTPELASKNSTNSDCYVDPHSGLIYVRALGDEIIQPFMGAHTVQLDNGEHETADTMRVILPQEMVDHLHADPVFDGAYHHLTGTVHRDGEDLPAPGAQADYQPETHQLLATGSFDMVSPLGGIDNVAMHRIADVGPYDKFDTNYPAADRSLGPDLSQIRSGDWESNYGPCVHGQYVGADSEHLGPPPPVDIPIHDFVQHAFDPPAWDAEMSGADAASRSEARPAPDLAAWSTPPGLSHTPAEDEGGLPSQPDWDFSAAHGLDAWGDSGWTDHDSGRFDSVPDFSSPSDAGDTGGSDGADSSADSGGASDTGSSDSDGGQD